MPIGIPIYDVVEVGFRRRAYLDPVVLLAQARR
jgi:hypothetical protein